MDLLHPRRQNQVKVALRFFVLGSPLAKGAVIREAIGDGDGGFDMAMAVHSLPLLGV